MDDLLKVLKKNGCLPPSSRTFDLRDQILNWGGGYNWLGPERVLNPLAIVNLFSKKKFKSSWIQNDPPARLKELIQSRPLDFLDPYMVYCRFSKIGKVDLERLDPGLVLFHSGYLTIKEEIISSMTPDDGHRCTFKFPNKEAEDGFSSLIDDVFGQKTWQGLKNLAPAFLKAADRRDSAAIAGLFTNLLTGLTSFQPEAGRNFYHALIQTCLAFGLGKVPFGRCGALGRSDIIVERPGDRYLIIEVKYRKSQARHTEADIKQILAKASEEALKQIVEKDYAGTVRYYAKEILGLSVAVYGRKDVRSDFVTQNLLKDAKWSGQKVRPD
jgi:hypothetical protein